MTDMRKAPYESWPILLLLIFNYLTTVKTSKSHRKASQTLTFQIWLTALSVHSATSMEWLCWPMRGPKQVRTGMVSPVHTPISEKTPTAQSMI